MQTRAATGMANDLNFEPTYASTDACSQSFGTCFLGGEACRQAFGSLLLAQAIGQLGRGVNPIEEATSEPVHGVLDALNFDQIDAGADNHLS